MTDANDLVPVTRGTLIEVEHFREVLRDAGITSRIVGDNLTAGLGTALPGSIELWVHRADLAVAEVAVAGAHKLHTKEHPAHGHPVSDPKPDSSRGPSHGAPPHRPLPS